MRASSQKSYLLLQNEWRYQMEVFYRLLLCLWALVCAIHTSNSQSECTSGFMSRDRVRDLSRVVGGRLRTRERQQRIIPMINFTCSGSINKWTVAAKWNGSEFSINFPQLEIWRIQSEGSNMYNRVGFTLAVETTENDNETYEFVLSPPLQFESGDILGIFNPLRPRLGIYYVETTGPPNYLTTGEETSPSTPSFTISGNTASQNDLPLITVDTSSSNGRSDCTNGFTSLDGILVGLGRLENRDRQQRITPHINFTCDGAITKWIVDGRWNDGGMRDWYPDLQIWRNTGTNMFTKVGNTALRVEGGSNSVTYYEYSLTTPLNFQAGDVLGIFQPYMRKNRLRMYFLSGVGPRNYYETLASNNIVDPPSDVFTLGAEYENDLPLVAVEITIATTAPPPTTTPPPATTPPPTTTAPPTTTTTSTSELAITTTTAASTTTTAAGTTTAIAGIAETNSTSGTSTDATATIISDGSHLSTDPATPAGSQTTGTPPVCETTCSTNQTPDHTSPSPLSTAATIGIAVSGTVLLVVVLLLVVIFVLARKHLHSKQTAGELYETSDAIGMKENEAYGTNAQTQNITTAANEAYGCVGGIPVVENVAYIPVNISTVQNEAYGTVETG